jgi:hypothetical protein
MCDSRLGGRARSPINPCGEISDLHIQTIHTMSEALQLSRRKFWAKAKDSDQEIIRRIGDRPVDGDKLRLAAAVERSEQLMADAIQVDQRLARKAQWLRRDEGEHCDSGLLASGDDQPFYKCTKRVVNDATMAGEPLRIVISTDDNKVPEGTAAAFIATARLVQQFIPLEIWWQGAWLTAARAKGFVFHVPLVQGDMDFSRLEFCIADPMRDMFSYMVMATHAVLDIKEGWNECGYRAEEHYLGPWSNLGSAVITDNYGRKRANAKFISHHGITPDSYSIAWTAARWIGWQAAYMEEYDENRRAESAAQKLPDPERPYKPMSQKEQDDYERRQAQILLKEKQEAESRLQPA